MLQPLSHFLAVKNQINNTQTILVNTFQTTQYCTKPPKLKQTVQEMA